MYLDSWKIRSFSELHTKSNTRNSTKLSCVSEKQFPRFLCGANGDRQTGPISSRCSPLNPHSIFQVLGDSYCLMTSRSNLSAFTRRTILNMDLFLSSTFLHLLTCLRNGCTTNILINKATFLCYATRQKIFT